MKFKSKKIGKRNDFPASSSVTNGNSSESPGKLVKLKRSATLDKDFKKPIKKHKKTQESPEMEPSTIDKILDQILSEENHSTFIEDWFERLQNFLLQLPAQTENQIKTNAVWIDKKIHLPMLTERLKLPEIRHKFSGISAVHLIGSEALGTSLVSGAGVDVCVVIHKNALTKDSFKDLEYHRIRAFYLCYLAMKLVKWDPNVSVAFQFHNSNHFHPILLIKPPNSPAEYCTFNIHVICEENTFKMNRLLPSIRNISTKLFEGIPNSLESGFSPHYNGSIVQDLTILRNLAYIKESIGASANVKNAILMIKKWLKMRCSFGDLERFTGFIATNFIVYLLEKKKFNGSSHVFDILRIFWSTLGNSHWHEQHQGISFIENSPNLEAFHKHFDVVFIDSTGYVNLCVNLSLESYLLVREEAQRALSLLNGPEIEKVFLIEVPVHIIFDHILTIQFQANLLEKLIEQCDKEYYFDYCCNGYPAFSKIISKLIRKGLSDRISSIVPITLSIRSWPIKQQCRTPETLSMGLILNTPAALDIMNKGPSANQMEAEEFKQFWGKKSEMRRFQDGSILETCLWKSPNDPLSEKRLICKEIIIHLLDRHLGIPKKCIKYVANEFDLSYRVENLDQHGTIVDVTNSEHLALSVVKCFNEVAKCLRGIEGIPLDISSIVGISPVFRYLELKPIQAIAREFIDSDGVRVFQSYVVNEAVIQFAANAKWPQELQAIKRIKAALFLKMAEKLRKQFGLKVHANSDNIEVLKDGFLFRFYIGLHKELLLMKKERTSKGVLKYSDTPHSLEFEKRFFMKPKLNTVLHTLYHNCNSFGPAVLIAKRWLYSQLIDSVLWPDECTELAMAYLYSQQNILPNPTQPQAAFFRFLHLLSTVDWNAEMLFINFSDLLSDDQIANIHTKFQKDRNAFPPMTIVTSVDEGRHSVWTKAGPSREILARVVLLSTHAHQVIEKRILSQSLLSQAFFCPSTDGYDALITLRKCHVHPCHLHDFLENTKRKKVINEKIPIVDFDPIKLFLAAIREAYSDFAYFFYDPCAGVTIGVLWKPEAFAKVEFSTSSVAAKCSVNGKLKTNFKQIIEDFKIIGHGLVELVTVKTSID